MFSMLRTLLVCLSGVLGEPWLQSNGFLRKARVIATKFNNHVLMSFGLSGVCVFKAFEDAYLELHSAFLGVQEMLSQWAQILSYITDTGQWQENPRADKFSYIVGTDLFLWFDKSIDNIPGSGFRYASNGRRIFRKQTIIVQRVRAGLP